MKKQWLALAGAVLLLPPLLANAQFYGPFDYTNPDHFQNKLPVVEQYHFNRAVETLTGTMPGGQIGDHLAYVIRSFPNHHRALAAMAKYWRDYMSRSMRPPGMPPNNTPDVLFERAMEFAPHDGVVPLLYGIHLIAIGGADAKARELLYRADELGQDQAELQYNLGLTYLKIGEVNRAVASAERAYTLNYPLPGLRKKLIEAGAWPASQPLSTATD